MGEAMLMLSKALVESLVFRPNVTIQFEDSPNEVLRLEISLRAKGQQLTRLLIIYEIRTACGIFHDDTNLFVLSAVAS